MQIYQCVWTFIHAGFCVQCELQRLFWWFETQIWQHVFSCHFCSNPAGAGAAVRLRPPQSSLERSVWQSAAVDQEADLLEVRMNHAGAMLQQILSRFTLCYFKITFMCYSSHITKINYCTWHINGHSHSVTYLIHCVA